MTPPRYVQPGQLLFITRRCHRRRFALRPSRAVNTLFLYLLALATRRFGIEICAAIVMSSHVHFVIHDRRGVYPAFLRWLDSLVTRALNARRKTADSIWSTKEPDVAILADAEAVVAKIAYTLANPIRAGAVRHGRDWPGVRTNPESYTRVPLVVERPKFVFRQTGEHRLPDSVAFKLAVPPTHAHLAPEAFGRLLAERVAAEEADAREEVRSSGRTFGTPEGCRAVSHEHRPEGTGPRGPGTGSRAVIARDATSGDALCTTLRAFRAAYAETRAQWLEGIRDVLWPSGTWMMVQTHNLRAYPPP